MEQSTGLFLLCLKKERTAPCLSPWGYWGCETPRGNEAPNTQIMRIRSVAGFTCNANTLKFVSKEGEVSSPFTTRE